MVLQVAVLADWARSAVQHDRVRADYVSLAAIKRPDVNIVHLRRGLPSALSRLTVKQVKDCRGYKHEARVKSSSPDAALDSLLAPLLHARLDGLVVEGLRADLLQLVRAFNAELATPEVNVKLEVAEAPLCTRFHADHVGVRCLCTYVGEGTLYVENRHARRTWDLLPPGGGGGGAVAVSRVDASHVQQAGNGDLLFLKGHLYPGNFGMGAVHRSPDGVASDHPRLLLTVDDSEPAAACSSCSCDDGGQQHDSSSSHGQ